MSRRTIARPSPRLPPVTITLRMTDQLASGGKLERRHETDCRRNLVAGQAIVANSKDLALVGRAQAARGRIVFQNDICNDQRTSNRASSWAHHRHADCRVPVDGCLDFLRVDLQSADVDRAAAP